VKNAGMKAELFRGKHAFCGKRELCFRENGLRKLLIIINLEEASQLHD
jgi:hypothetical protein